MLQLRSPPRLLVDYLMQKELAAGLKVTERPVQIWRATGAGRYQVGKTVYYRRETLRRWLESRDAKPTNERPRMRRCAVTWWPAGRAMLL